MKIAIRVLLVFAVAAFLLPESSKASVVFKPGKKPEYVGPGGVDAVPEPRRRGPWLRSATSESQAHGLRLAVPAGDRAALTRPRGAPGGYSRR